jgi:hypothetical protein
MPKHSNWFLSAILILCSYASVAQCGTERVKVKTLKDEEESEISFTPKHSSVHEQLQFAKPPFHDDNPREPSEKQVYIIEAYLIKYKKETNDNDYHLVVQDIDSDEQMVVEVPSLSCADAGHNEHFSHLKEVRNILSQQLGNFTTSYKYAPEGTRIRVTGVGFFDKRNHPRGFKGRELHPVLNLEFIDN